MLRRLIIISSLALLPSCTTSKTNETFDGPFRLLGESTAIAGYSGNRSVAAIDRNSEPRNRASYVELADSEDVVSSIKKPLQSSDGGKSVTLNFVDSPVEEFVRVVFDEIVREPVVLDASLKGKITLRTQSPVSKSVALDLVRQALQATGASMVKTDSAYRISARIDGKGMNRIGDSVRVVPLHYITADEAKGALAAFGQSGIGMEAGPRGAYLILTGAGLDLDNIEQALASLDVDQMKGMSFGLFPLREANAVVLAAELSQMFGRQNNSAAFRVLPIERMNAILVISSQARRLEEARKWLQRLDQSDKDGRKIYVYNVQNRRAADVAKVLTAVLDEKARRPPQENVNRTVAPQLSPMSGGSGAGLPMSLNTPVSRLAGPTTTGSIPADNNPANLSHDKSSTTRVTADIGTNSIVVTANEDEWKVIRRTLRRLDVSAPQVLIEATIAEVTLNDALKHGVRWYFEQGNHIAALSNGNVASDGLLNAGFNYAFGVPKARIVVNALEQVTHVAIVSSPALTVLDNQTARLQVGDEVPMATRSAVSVSTPDAPVVNDIELKDTGVILSVTPRVNSSGLVTLDITQEVSEVVPTTSSSLNSPTIRQRKLNSSVAVYSGMDIVLGGLISASRTKDESGIPFAMDVPWVGNLFKNDAKKAGDRTELVVILRPTIMTSGAAIRSITEEIKSRMGRTLRSFQD